MGPWCFLGSVPREPFGFAALRGRVLYVSQNPSQRPSPTRVLKLVGMKPATAVPYKRVCEAPMQLFTFPCRVQMVKGSSLNSPYRHAAFGHPWPLSGTATCLSAWSLGVPTPQDCPFRKRFWLRPQIGHFLKIESLRPKIFPFGKESSLRPKIFRFGKESLRPKIFTSGKESSLRPKIFLFEKRVLVESKDFPLRKRVC